MTTIKGIRSTSGVLSLMQGAGKNKDEINFLLNGDLNQMSIQEAFLRGKGFKLGWSDVYPGFYTQEEYKRGLKEIWDNKCEGWWNYREVCIKYGISSTEDAANR